MNKYTRKWQAGNAAVRKIKAGQQTAFTKQRWAVAPKAGGRTPARRETRRAEYREEMPGQSASGAAPPGAPNAMRNAMAAMQVVTSGRMERKARCRTKPAAQHSREPHPNVVPNRRSNGCGPRTERSAKVDGFRLKPASSSVYRISW